MSSLNLCLYCGGYGKCKYYDKVTCELCIGSRSGIKDIKCKKCYNTGVYTKTTVSICPQCRGTGFVRY